MLSALFNPGFQPPAGPYARFVANPSLSQKNQAVENFTVKVAEKSWIFPKFAAMEKQTDIRPFGERVDEFLEHVKYVISHTQKGSMPLTKEFFDEFSALADGLSDLSEEKCGHYDGRCKEILALLKENPDDESLRTLFVDAKSGADTGMLLMGAAAFVLSLYNNYAREYLAAGKNRLTLRAAIGGKGVPS